MTSRHLVTAVTMLFLCALLVAGAVYGWRSFLEDPTPDEAAGDDVSEGCSTQPVEAGQKIRSGQVRVSVYNSGQRAGLADRTRTSLESRGFKPGQVGNAPADVSVRRVQVWSTVENDPKAMLVARQFGKKVKVRVVEQDLGPGIDVIVGNKFKELVKAPRAMRIKQETSICVDPTTAG
jgi:hypothetical protein